MDKNTLDNLYKLYMTDVYRYLLYLCKDKYLAEDLLQDTFFRAYLYLEDCPPDNVKPWLFRVAHNSFIDSTRKNKRSSPTDAETLNNIEDPKSTEKDLLIKEQLSLVKSVMKNMPEKQKKALKLCVFKGLSYKEAAEVMGVSVSHLKILVFRARQTLKDNIERMD
ncbi:MAG: sigma-70 family RNA polymerase sigma factor [Clostridium sp.]